MLSSNLENLFFAIPPKCTSGSPEIANGRETVPGTLMNDICAIGTFLRTLRMQTRFGQLVPRAPLRLLRFEFRGEIAECDWMARPADAWDAQLPRQTRERSEAAQALEDAIAIRDLVFAAFPAVSVASVRAFRESAELEPEMIICGTVTREHVPPRSVPSLAMRAKLCGLRFVLEDGVLLSSQSEACAMNF